MGNRADNLRKHLKGIMPAVFLLVLALPLLSACGAELAPPKKSVEKFVSGVYAAVGAAPVEVLQPKDIDRPFIKSGEPRIGLVAANILAVPILDGQVIHGSQVPYVPELTDFVSSNEGKSSVHWLIRRGAKIGALVGQNRATLMRFDQIVNHLPDTGWLDNPSSYELSSPSDSTYSRPVPPSQVNRKSRPIDLAETGPDVFSAPPQLHTMYLHFNTALREGQEYRIRIRGGQLPDQVFRFSSEHTRSEAVHVNTLGFHPSDGSKVAFVSTWLGNGGGLTYPPNFSFKVVADATGKTVLSGQASLSLAASAGEDHSYRNFSGTDVHLLDFSSLNQVGRYRIVVPGIGTSYPFVISPDVWTRAFAVNTRGLYHQRSGIAHVSGFSPFIKPRDLHPADGVKVFQSSCSLMESGNGLNTSDSGGDNFSCLVKGRTSALVPEAWGGYHDAGDWDRRIQHLDASRALIELYELFPDVMRNTVLDIPKSNTALPDVLDEALWSMAIFHRLQTPEGGIRGGIEFDNHPISGETSWTVSQTVMVYAPDLWSSYLYAADAARLAILLRAFDVKLAADYEASALRATRYAEDAYRKSGQRQLPFEVVDARNLTAAAMYKLTGASEWHEIYRETNRITTLNTPLNKHSNRKDNNGWNQANAAFLYLTIKNRTLDPAIQANLLNAFKMDAEASLKRISRTGFKWLKESDDAWVGWGTLGASQTRNLLRAHHLFSDRRFLDAALEASQFSLGANPVNMSFTTGLGSNAVRRLWVIDARTTGQEVPDGITAYGPIDPVHIKDDKNFNRNFAPYVYPKASSWPANENYFDVYGIYPMNEFTISETIAPNIYTWGYLSAIYSPTTGSR